MLFTAWVIFCDPTAQQYAEAASRVPPEHWRLVKRVGITTGDEASAASNGLVVLLAERDEGGLFHEVGHLVAMANDRELEQTWELIFWDEGRPRWSLPSRKAIKDWSEDFAESYRFLIEGRLEDCCPAWLGAEAEADILSHLRSHGPGHVERDQPRRDASSMEERWT